jgi:hypothetical protein
MPNDKGQNNHTKQSHISARPMAVCATVKFVIRISAARLSVMPCQVKALDRMQQNKCIQAIRNGLDQGIGSHEIRVLIECQALIFLKQLQVANQVNDQKEDEKETGQGHDNFPSDRRSE